MSSSAASAAGACVTAPTAYDCSNQSNLQMSSCASMHDACESFSEQESDFISSLLATQDAAVQPVHLFTDDNAESSGDYTVLSDVSTTFGDWGADSVTLQHSSNLVPCLNVPVNPTSLMLQLDYGDVISAWEEMSSDQRHPIDSSLHNNSHPNQLTTLQTSVHTVPQPSLPILSAIPAANPVFAVSPRSSMTASEFAPVQSKWAVGISGQGASMQQPCAPHTAAGKTASLERYWEKTATRTAGPKIRCQIRKTTTNHRPRLKGCNVAPTRLAELQVDAMLNDNGDDPESPNTSGRSSSSECS